MNAHACFPNVWSPCELTCFPLPCGLFLYLLFFTEYPWPPWAPGWGAEEPSAELTPGSPPG